MANKTKFHHRSHAKDLKLLGPEKRAYFSRVGLKTTITTFLENKFFKEISLRMWSRNRSFFWRSFFSNSLSSLFLT